MERGRGLHSEAKVGCTSLLRRQHWKHGQKEASGLLWEIGSGGCLPPAGIYLPIWLFILLMPVSQLVPYVRQPGTHREVKADGEDTE